MNRVRIRVAFTSAILAMWWTAPAASQTSGKWNPPRTSEGRPDLSGTWTNATIIPLERPKDLEGKQTFTPQEYAEYEKKVFARSDRDRPGQTGVGTYNGFWWDQDTKLAPNLHT